MLTVNGLRAGYGGGLVLDGLDLTVPAGGCLALLGRNGAGKSTTLKAIMGLVPPAGGAIHFEGRRLDGLPPYRIARAGLGYVPEDRRVFPDLSVAENLEAGRRAPAQETPAQEAPAQEAGAPRPWTTERVFALFPALADLRDRPAGRTSGGEQQMLALARTLMGNPRLLLLDEPSEGLAPVLVQAVVAAMATMRAAGLTILLSEQNLPVARALADRAVVLDQGRKRFEGDMADLSPEASLTRELLAL